MTELLEVAGLTVEINGRGQPVEDVSFSLSEGESLALVGESGCGKTLTALAIMGLLPHGARIVAGRVTVGEQSVGGLSEHQMSEVRGRVVAMVFQDPMTALNPVVQVGWQIAELFAVHERASRSEARRKAISLLERVGIPDPARRYREYPHQFSGGMRQRALIAMAVALQPQILIADEPTTALDVTVQAQILELLAGLRKETGLATILITHDLGVVAALADSVVVMYAGRLVEKGRVDDFYRQPSHPYGRGLLASVPRLGTGSLLTAPIAGTPPSLGAFPSGCRFHPRCPYADTRCEREVPELREFNAGSVACHHAEELDA